MELGDAGFILLWDNNNMVDSSDHFLSLSLGKRKEVSFPSVDVVWVVGERKKQPASS